MRIPQPLSAPTISESLLLGSGIALLVVVPFSNALIEIATALLMLGALGALWLKRLTIPRPFLQLIALWMIACLASVVMSSDPALSWRTLLRKTSQYATLGVIASYLGQDARTANRLLTALVWAGILIGLDALLQEMWGHDLLRFRATHGGRLTGPLNSPNSLASYLLVVMPLQLWAMLHGVNRWAMGGLLLGLGLETFVLVQTDAVASWLTLLIVLVVLAVLSKRASFLSCLVVVGAIGLWRWEGPSMLARLLQLDPGRVEGWRIAWRMFLDHPIVGIGLGTYMANYMAYVPSLEGTWPRPQYAHNCYLQLLGEGGVLGFGAFLLMIGWVFAVSLKRLNRSQAARHSFLPGLLAALTAFLVNIAFDTGLYSLPLATLFWFLLGLTAGQVGSEAKSLAHR